VTAKEYRANGTEPDRSLPVALITGGMTVLGMPDRLPIILVVDDEVTIRAYLCAYLRDCGFLAWGVESADNAIRLLDLGVTADLVFSDMHMPGRHDGYGLARWVAEHRPELPVILTSGSMTRENALLYHIEMLPKPYELGSAVIRIRQVIERHRPH
jgi:DNA-binding NtrC family response regulator